MRKLKLFSREQVGNASDAGRQYSRLDSLSLVSRQSVLAFLLVLLTTIFGVGNAWGETVTYTVTSTSAVSSSGTEPEGSSATYSSTNNTKCQLTGGKSMTLTLSGFDGCTITGLTLSMKSNSSKGKGSMSMTVGSTNIANIADSKFNTENWAGKWSTSYLDIKPAVTATTVASGEKIDIKIAATENSLYCQSFTLTYDAPSSGGGETPDPTPGTGGTGTINFNGDAVKINSASVTGQDDLNNTWTITTEGTTSFTSNSAYYQVGSGSKPATSITFTTTLSEAMTISAFSAKFGGFSETAGTVTLKVGETTVGTGSLNASTDVTVNASNTTTSGNTLTVTVTGISKGVKAYYISYTCTSGGTPKPTV